MQNRRNKMVIYFLTNNFNLYGIPEKIKSDKGEALYRKNTENLVNVET